jgi:hypothetical protein
MNADKERSYAVTIQTDLHHPDDSHHDDSDSVDAMTELLSQMSDASLEDTVEEFVVPLCRKYTLCPTCHERFIVDPFARIRHRSFSSN